MGRGKGGKGTVRETPEKGSYGESQPLRTLAFRKETEPLLNSTSTENHWGRGTFASVHWPSSLLRVLPVGQTQPGGKPGHFVQVILHNHHLCRTGSVLSKSEEAMKTVQHPFTCTGSNIVTRLIFFVLLQALLSFLFFNF